MPQIDCSDPLVGLKSLVGLQCRNRVGHSRELGTFIHLLTRIIPLLESFEIMKPLVGLPWTIIPGFHEDFYNSLKLLTFFEFPFRDKEKWFLVLTSSYQACPRTRVLPAL